MFKEKKSFDDLVKRDVETKSEDNPFIQAALRRSSITRSGNSAMKYSTTGNDFVDQFGSISSYRAERDFSEIDYDCEKLWSIDKEKAVKFFLYLRMISRRTYVAGIGNTEEIQRGAEMKHEGIMRFIWLYLKDPKVFWDNFHLFISVGSWRDVFKMLEYDYIYNGDDRALDWDAFISMILSAKEDQSQVDLIKKYLPTIRTNKKCTTPESLARTYIGKKLAANMFPGVDKINQYRKYRKFKSSGTAHEWQQIISRRDYERLEFDKIHGKALHLLSKGKFLHNQGLARKFGEWMSKKEERGEDMKYTGFVHDLFKDIRSHDSITHRAINLQFKRIVNNSDASQEKYIVVRDTSGSMSSKAVGTSMLSGDIAKAIAIYFSEFLKGTAFENSWIEFHSEAKLRTWIGSTPTEKYLNDHSSYVGSTDFISVIKLFCDLKRSGIREEDFPSGILCISDGEFDYTRSYKMETNIESMFDLMRSAGFTEEYMNNFKVVLWDIRNLFHGGNRKTTFETFGDVRNIFYFGGYSASVISFLTKGISSSEELLEEALNQELLHMVKV